MKAYYVFWGKPNWTGFEIKKFYDYNEMIDAVREHFLRWDFLPVVYYGEALEFEPAEIVKSWKVKENP